MKGIKNMDNIEEIKKKYAKSVIKNLNRENFYKIINFLESNNCDFIEDIVSDYLDLFNIEYVEFVKKYNSQEKKLFNMTMIFVEAFSMLGWITSIYKRSILWGILGIPGGVIAGLGVGAMISSNKKNNLMDKYNVKEVTKN